MNAISTLLSNHTWRMLRAVFLAHRWDFNSEWTKEEALDLLSSKLADEETLQAILKLLPSEAYNALLTLRDADGAMPSSRFLHHFGPLPPYRPWVDSSPRAPWLHPESPAQRLWFLGLIFKQEKCSQIEIVLPKEVYRLLPQASLAPEKLEPPTVSSCKTSIILDIAHLLAYLQGHRVRALHGRWLAPTQVRTLNRRFAHPDARAPEARSELQTGYLRFVHYLAECAGLVAPALNHLTPTPAAWAWLAAPESDRHRILRDGWLADLDTPSPETARWTRYRLPGPPAWVRTALDVLGTLAPGTYRLNAMLQAVRIRSLADDTLPPGDDLAAHFEALRSGPLGWCGWLTAPADADPAWTPLGAWVLGQPGEPPAAPATEPVTVDPRGDDLLVTLPAPPARPPLEAWVALALPLFETASTELRARMYHLSHRHVAELLSRGTTPVWIAQTLETLTLGVLSAEARRRIDTWAEQTRSVRVRDVTLLTAGDPALLNELAGQRRLQPHLRETLSPHHLTVAPDSVTQVLHTLRRLGYAPLMAPEVAQRAEGDAAPSGSDAPETLHLDAGAVGQLWLALRILMSLRDLARLPVASPAGLAKTLAQALDGTQLAALRDQADTAITRFRDVVDGYAAYAAYTPATALPDVRAHVEQALETGQPLKIVYLTAGRGERTRRVVEPLRLETRGGAVYLIAYCRLRQAERVFRLDRIVEIAPEENSKV